MKNKIIAAAILLTGFATNANSQATAYATTTATLVVPISIVKDVDMNFGTVAASPVAGTVVLGYANDRTAALGASIRAGVSPTTASFTVTGEDVSGFTVSIPSSPITLTGVPSGSMTVSNFLCEQGAVTALVGGTKILKIGATLNVSANQVAGVYTNALANASGLFVTVNYN